MRTVTALFAILLLAAPSAAQGRRHGHGGGSGDNPVAPSIQITVPDHSPYSDSILSQTFAGTATEGSSALVDVKVTCSGATTVTAATAAGTATWTYPLVLNVGTTDCYAVVTDAGARTAQTSLQEFVITNPDSQAPVVTIVSDGGNGVGANFSTTASSYTLSVDCSDDVACSSMTWSRCAPSAVTCTSSSSGSCTVGTAPSQPVSNWSCAVTLATVGGITTTNAITITALDTSTQSGTDTITITRTVALSITTTALGDGFQGSSYSATLAAAGGTTGSYTWDNNGGGTSLNDADAQCAGLSVSSGGVISGTPSATGVCSWTARVHDAADSVTKPFTITVQAPGSETADTYYNTWACWPATGTCQYAFGPPAALDYGTPPNLSCPTLLDEGLGKIGSWSMKSDEQIQCWTKSGQHNPIISYVWPGQGQLDGARLLQPPRWWVAVDHMDVSVDHLTSTVHCVGTCDFSAFDPLNFNAGGTLRNSLALQFKDTQAAAVNGAFSAGVVSINIDGMPASNKLTAGDDFTIAGDATTYTVIATQGGKKTIYTADGAGALAGLPFTPPLASPAADNAVVSITRYKDVNQAYSHEEIVQGADKTQFTLPIDVRKAGTGGVLGAIADCWNSGSATEQMEWPVGVQDNVTVIWDLYWADSFAPTTGMIGGVGDWKTMQIAGGSTQYGSASYYMRSRNNWDSAGSGAGPQGTLSWPDVATFNTLGAGLNGSPFPEGIISAYDGLIPGGPCDAALGCTGGTKPTPAGDTTRWKGGRWERYIGHLVWNKDGRDFPDWNTAYNNGDPIETYTLTSCTSGLNPTCTVAPHTYTAAINGAAAAGATRINVDGLYARFTLYDNSPSGGVSPDTLTIAGDATVYTVNKIATANASGAISQLSITPALVSAAADNAVVTITRNPRVSQFNDPDIGTPVKIYGSSANNGDDYRVRTKTDATHFVLEHFDRSDVTFATTNSGGTFARRLATYYAWLCDEQVSGETVGCRRVYWNVPWVEKSLYITAFMWEANTSTVAGPDGQAGNVEAYFRNLIFLHNVPDPQTPGSPLDDSCIPTSCGTGSLLRQPKR